MKNRIGILIFFLLIILDIFIWSQLLSVRAVRPGDYFLDVGQGDSELTVFPDGARILIDGGPSPAVVGALEKIFRVGDRYLDLVINSHPQLDHFAGLSTVFDSFEVGAFLTNGRDDSPNVAEWGALIQKAQTNHVPMFALARSDTIKNGSSTIKILSPDLAVAQSAELNDTGIVALAEMPGLRTLFTADIGSNIEQYLITQKNDLHADVLKVAHHGSKYSSSDAFLRAVNPRIVAIEVGAKNTYGHPTPQTLARIASGTHAQVFRTDQNGTIAVFSENGKLKVITEKF